AGGAPRRRGTPAPGRSRTPARPGRGQTAPLRNTSRTWPRRGTVTMAASLLRAARSRASARGRRAGRVLPDSDTRSLPPPAAGLRLAPLPHHALVAGRPAGTPPSTRTGGRT